MGESSGSGLSPLHRSPHDTLGQSGDQDHAVSEPMKRQLLFSLPLLQDRNGRR